MKLADLSVLVVRTTFNCIIPLATFVFSLILKTVITMLQLARTKISGLVYHTFVVYRKRFLNVVHKNPTKVVARKMGWVLSLLPAVSCTAASPVVPVKPDEENRKNLIFEADKLYNEHSYTKLRDLLLQFKGEHNAEILWRLARATYEVAKLSANPSEQKELDLEAFRYVERALLLDPDNFAVHKWMFIMLDKKSSYEGLKERISKSFDVKKHIERACELNPKDGTSFHLLGYWCFSVAELPWFQRQIASTLFATPPVSSYEEALQYFLRAEQVEPNFYSMNLLMIGKTYLRLKNKEKAASYLIRARDYPAASAEDVEAKQEAVKLLSSI